MEEFINAFPIWHLSTFFVGMTIARLITLDLFPDLFRQQAPLFLILSLLVFAYLIYVPNPILKYIHNGLLAPLFGIFVAALFYDISFLHRFLSLKPVSKLGDLSYGIFIFQYPLWVICKSLAGEENAKRSLFFLFYFSCVLFVSWFVNRYFEKPVLARLRR